MNCARKILEIKDPFPTYMEIPGHNTTYLGRIPRSVVLYTGSGILLSGLRHVAILERPTFVVDGTTVGMILTLNAIEPGDHLEFERHSSTDVIIRAYDRHGLEKNSNRERNSHWKVHFRVQLQAGFRESLDLSTVITHPITTPIGLMTALGHHWVRGTSVPAPGDGRFRLQGPAWDIFQRLHQLEQGVILVFKKDPHVFNYEVFFYNADGSEAGAISRKPTGFRHAGMSFYKYPREINMEGTELLLGRRFVEENWNLLTHGVRVASEAGIFNMKYDRNSQQKYAITGEWNTIFQYFSTTKNTVFKFSLSFNNNRCFWSGCCTIFVVAFKGKGCCEEISLEVSSNPRCSSAEESTTNLPVTATQA